MIMNYIAICFLLIILSCTDTRTKNTSSKFVVSPQTYKIKVCDYFGETTEGGEVKGYFYKDRIEKIEVVLYAELGKIVKEFIIDSNVSNSYEFKQKYYSYNKPFHYQDFKVLDSLTVLGTINNGKIKIDSIIGNNVNEEYIYRISSKINSEIEIYIQFLGKCKNKGDLD